MAGLEMLLRRMFFPRWERFKPLEQVEKSVVDRLLRDGRTQGLRNPVGWGAHGGAPPWRGM